MKLLCARWAVIPVSNETKKRQEMLMLMVMLMLMLLLILLLIYSLFFLNCQSLRAHTVDLTDIVAQRANILLLSETWINNEEAVDVPNFDCVVHFKRPNVRAGGVAVYHNSTDRINIVTPHMDMNLQQINWLAVNAAAVEDICAAECVIESGQSVAMIVLYITPNQRINDILKFIHRALLVYIILHLVQQN